MANRRTATRQTRIEARVTFDGPAEEVLRAAQTLQGAGNRRVQITIVNSRGGPIPDYYSLPEIKQGQTQRALEFVDDLSKQTIVDTEAEHRVTTLVRAFGRFTAE